MVQRILDNGALPPEARDVLERYGRGGALGAGFFIVRKIASLMMWGFVGGIFSTLGGLLGALIFKTQTRPGVIDVPPTA